MIEKTTSTEPQVSFWNDPDKMRWVERVVVLVGLVLAAATVVCTLHFEAYRVQIALGGGVLTLVSCVASRRFSPVRAKKLKEEENFAFNGIRGLVKQLGPTLGGYTADSILDGKTLSTHCNEYVQVHFTTIESFQDWETHFTEEETHALVNANILNFHSFKSDLFDTSQQDDPFDQFCTKYSVFDFG